MNEDECKEAIAFMHHSSDEDTIKKKMKLTFDYRHNMVLDPMQSNEILTIFSRFKDIKGLIEQDFVLMFGEGVGEVDHCIQEKRDSAVQKASKHQ